MATTIQAEQRALYQLTWARKSGREVLTNAADVLRRAADEMDKQVITYDDTEIERRVKPEEVLGWACNAVASIQSNLRLDMFVSRAADLASRRAVLETVMEGTCKTCGHDLEDGECEFCENHSDES